MLSSVSARKHSMDNNKPLRAQKFFEFLGLPQRSLKSDGATYHPLTETDTESEMSMELDDLTYQPFTETDTESEMSEDDMKDERGNTSKVKNTFNQHTLNSVNENVDTSGIVEDSNDFVQSEVYPYLAVTQTNPITEPGVKLAQRRDSSNKWDKKHACKFCQKEVIKMSAHLQRVHKDESEVAQVLTLKKGTQERRKAWIKLLKEGDFEHNFSVLKAGTGTLIPKYRSKNRNAEDFVTCPYCRGMYCRSLLARHITTCSENHGDALKRGQSVREGGLLMPVPQKFSSECFAKHETG